MVRCLMIGTLFNCVLTLDSFLFLDWLHTTGKRTNIPTRRGRPQTVEYTPWCSMEAFLDMRDNPETYEVFFTWFIPAIGRKTYWKHIVANAEKDDDITTISNEAFVLLVLENNWDCWLEIFKRNDGNLISSRGRGKHHTECNIQPKYTQVGGISSSQEEKSVEMGKGWTNEGIE